MLFSLFMVSESWSTVADNYAFPVWGGPFSRWYQNWTHNLKQHYSGGVQFWYVCGFNLAFTWSNASHIFFTPTFHRSSPLHNNPASRCHGTASFSLTPFPNWNHTCHYMPALKYLLAFISCLVRTKLDPPLICHHYVYLDHSKTCLWFYAIRLKCILSDLLLLSGVKLGLFTTEWNGATILAI